MFSEVSKGDENAQSVSNPELEVGETAANTATDNSMSEDIVPATVAEPVTPVIVAEVEKPKRKRGRPPKGDLELDLFNQFF